MIRCQARILKVHKKSKAHSVPPILSHSKGKNPVANGLAECGGIVTVSIRVVGGCCCHGGAELETIAVCTVCKWPWWPGREEFLYNTAEALCKAYMEGGGL